MPVRTTPTPGTAPSTTTAHALQHVRKGNDHLVDLDDVSTAFAPGLVTGVIGENGCGKSTLLRVLAGVEDVDAGRVVATAAGGTGYLAQDAGAPPGATVGDVVDAALADLRRLRSRQQELESAMAGAADAELAALLAEVEGMSDEEARALTAGAEGGR